MNAGGSVRNVPGSRQKCSRRPPPTSDNPGSSILVSLWRMLESISALACPHSTSLFFSTHLLRYHPGEHVPALGLQQGFSVETTEEIQEGGDQSGPARLVAGAEPRAVVTVTILVKQDQIAPVRIFLKLGRPAVARPVPLGIAQKSAREPADKLLRHFEQRHVSPRTRWALDRKLIAVESVKIDQR